MFIVSAQSRVSDDYFPVADAQFASNGRCKSVTYGDTGRKFSNYNAGQVVEYLKRNGRSVQTTEAK
jgi:hypothetical protein